MNITSLRTLWTRVPTLGRGSRTRLKRNVLVAELLEGRDVPATINWINPSGGSWAVASNWEDGMIPGPDDCALIDLPDTGTVTVPYGYAATAWGVWSWAHLSVDGELTLQGASELESGLSIGEQGRVNAWMSPEDNGHGSLPLPWDSLMIWGGGVIAGVLDTDSATKSELDEGHFDIVGDGILTGDGLYTIGGDVDLLGVDQVVNNLYVGGSADVDGAPDITVNGRFLWAGGRLAGPTTSSLLLAGTATLLAPGGYGLGQNVLDGRKLEVAAGATKEIKADLTMKDGAVFENNGTVKTTQTSTILDGPGVNRIDNMGLWEITALEQTIQPRFVNGTNGKVKTETKVSFFDFLQQEATAELDLRKVTGTESGTARMAQAVLHEGSQKGGKVVIDSTVNNIGNATANIGDAVGFTVTKSGELNADGASKVTIEGKLSLSEESSAEFGGETSWVAGLISVVDSRIINSGTFTILCGDKIVGGTAGGQSGAGAFRNESLLVMNAAQAATLEGVAFENEAVAIVRVDNGSLTFSGGTGVERGQVEIKFNSHVFITDESIHSALTGSKFFGEGLLTLENGGTLAVPATNSTDIDNISLEGTDIGGVLAGLGEKRVNVKMDWTRGRCEQGTVRIELTAELEVKQNADVAPAAELVSCTLHIEGKATLKDDMAALAGAVIEVVDVGIMSVEASITSDPSAPAGYIAAVNCGQITISHGPGERVDPPVYNQWGELTFNTSTLTGGYFQEAGDATANGWCTFTGNAPDMNGNPTGYSIALNGGTLTMPNGQAKLITDRGVRVMSDATFRAHGSMDGRLVNDGLLIVAQEGQGTFIVSGDLTLLGNSEVRMKAGFAGELYKILAEGTMSLAGKLRLSTVAGLAGAWTLLQANTPIAPPLPDTISGTFSDVNGVPQGYSLNYGHTTVSINP
jgi:hypothetical protein